MSDDSLTRWQQFYANDPSLQSILPSSCAQQAARIFAFNHCQTILDLGCGTGRDSFHLAGSGVRVIGLDAARSGLLLAQKRVSLSQNVPLWVESDSRILPFPDVVFDGVYSFGLLHEFVGENAKTAVTQMMNEIYRVLKPLGMAIITAAAGDPKKGLPQVQNFSEAMFDTATARFRCVEKMVYDDLGCTGRTDYKVWLGYFSKE